MLKVYVASRRPLLAALGRSRKLTNVRFSNNIYDTASLTTRDDPESLVAIHLNDVVSSGLLAEAHYSRRKFADRTGSFATGQGST